MDWCYLTICISVMCAVVAFIIQRRPRRRKLK